MGDTYAVLDGELAAFLAAQHVFFVATAPLAADGHVNLSPKGLDTFRIVDRQTVAYLDLTGSGIETVAHLRENGRIVLCFCSFEGPPRIVRLHGQGEVLEPAAPTSRSSGRSSRRWRACGRSSASRWDASRTRAATRCRSCASRAIAGSCPRGRKRRTGRHRRLSGDEEPPQPRRTPGPQAKR
jgi:hypothetical protein